MGGWPLGVDEEFPAVVLEEVLVFELVVGGGVDEEVFDDVVEWGGVSVELVGGLLGDEWCT